MPTKKTEENQLLRVEERASGDVKITPVGTSGTDISGGQFFEEYLAALASQTEAADTWDEMRRSDDQVKMLLRVVKNPILSARWFVSSATEDEQDKKIAEFVQFALFDNMGTDEHPKTFAKFQREALSAVEFGYALFEITNKIVIDHPEFGSYIGLKGVDWRSPKTIEEWNIAKDGRLIAVRQTDNSERAQDVWIPGKFILHIAPEMEGDNYEGISMLRPIYGNWLRKDILRKINMIGYERAATGIPIGVIPRGQENSTAQAKLEDSMSRFVAHERQYMTVPEGFNIDSLKIEHDGDDLQKSIEAENVGMAKSFLANFMELGLNGTGSYALGTDLSDIFLSGISVYSDSIATAMNAKLIPMLVKLNFGEQAKYPELKIEGINDKAGREFAEIIGMLKDRGLLQITDELQELVHKRYKLPDFDKELASAAVDSNPQSTLAAPGKTAEAEKKSAHPGDNIKRDMSPPARLSEIEYSLAEASVGKNIEKVGKELTSVMAENMRARGEELVQKMMTIWRNAPRSKRMSEVNKLQVPGKADYKKIISGHLADVYVQSTNGVKKELASNGLKLAEPSEIRDLPAESKATGASQADLLVESQDADIRKNLFFSFTSKADVLPTEEQMNANLLNVVDEYVTGASIRTAGPNAVANAVNLARNAVFQQKSTLDQIESFIFQNPSPEALICKELTGRVFTKQEYVVSNKLPPLHHNCNSWIVAQIAGRPENRPLSPAGLTIQGTPDQINKIESSIRF